MENRYMYVIKVRNQAGEWCSNAFIDNSFDAIQVAKLYRDQLGYYVQIWHREKDVSFLMNGQNVEIVVNNKECAMTELEMKQALQEAMQGKYTWMLSGPADQMKAHCSHCGGAAPTDENGKTKLTDTCPHCGEEMFCKDEPRMWWDEDYDPDVDDPLKDLITPSTLNPEDSEHCLGNGLHQGYRIMCLECPYGETCAPELQ